MIVLLNILLPVILSIIAFIGFRKAKKAKTTYDECKIGIITAGIMILVFIVYSTIQPSYMPKGTAPNMSKVPLVTEEYELRDISIKAKSTEEHKAILDQELRYKRDVQELLKDDGKGKQ